MKRFLFVLFVCFVFFLASEDFAFSGEAEWPDEFCIGGVETTKINTSASFNYEYYCPQGFIGLDDNFTSNSFSGGLSELNISIPPGGSNDSVTLEVPYGIVLKSFNIGLDGIEDDSEDPVPVGVVLVTDVSGSMGYNCYDDSWGDPYTNDPNPCGDCNYGPFQCSEAACDCQCKMCDAKEANKVFVHTLFNDSHPETYLALTSYETDGYVDHCFSNDTASLNNTIDAYRPLGRTCFACGLNLSIQLLDTYPYENKVILLMTDGHDNEELGDCSGNLVCADFSSAGVDDECENNGGYDGWDISSVVEDHNITLYTVRFTGGGNAWYLRNMASIANDVPLAEVDDTIPPDYYFHAPSRDNLTDIYRSIAFDISHGEPENVTIDVGDTGTPQWNKSGPVGTENVDIAQWIMDILDGGCNCPSGGCWNNTANNNESCIIVLDIGSDNGGNITISNVVGDGSYGIGRVVSDEVNASVSGGATFSGWTDFCLEIENTQPNTFIEPMIVENLPNNDFAIINPADCANCNPGVLDGDTDVCFSINDLDPTIYNSLRLWADFNSTAADNTTELIKWNLSFLASTPHADAGPHTGGFYSCRSNPGGPPVNNPTFNGNGSWEDFYCDFTLSNRDICDVAYPTGNFTYNWTVFNFTSSWTGGLNGVKQGSFNCHNLSPGTYSVRLNVTNVKSGLYDTDIAELRVRPPPADLQVHMIELKKPIIRNFKSSSFVSVKNVGGSESVYNVSFHVFNESGDLVFDRTVQEKSLPGLTLRKRAFVWIPRDTGRYTVNASVLNSSTGEALDWEETNFLVIRIEEPSRYQGSEYPLMALLVVLIVVPTIAFFASKKS